MANTNTFEEFLTIGVPKINITELILTLVLAALLGYILSKIYIKYGRSISNKVKFANNFILLTTTTTLIITIVKSSLALSLGLVGALSIVRFRAAIKEPEELSFLFLCIATGLGFGAGQIIVTLTSFAIISTIIVIMHFGYNKNEKYNLYVTVSGKDISLKEVAKIIKKNSTGAYLRRFDESGVKELDALFVVDLKSFEDLEKLRAEIKKLSKSIEISYVDKADI